MKVEFVKREEIKVRGLSYNGENELKNLCREDLGVEYIRVRVKTPFYSEFYGRSAKVEVLDEEVKKIINSDDIWVNEINVMIEDKDYEEKIKVGVCIKVEEDWDKYYYDNYRVMALNSFDAFKQAIRMVRDLKVKEPMNMYGVDNIYRVD